MMPNPQDYYLLAYVAPLPSVGVGALYMAYQWDGHLLHQSATSGGDQMTAAPSPAVAEPLALAACVVAQPDTLQADRRENVTGRIGRDCRKAGARLGESGLSRPTKNSV